MSESDAPPEHAADPGPREAPPPADPDTEPTVGTGSVVGAGCSVVTVLVIVLGVAIFLLLRWL